MFLVAVVSSSGKPLMPCHPARARKLIQAGRAIRRFNKGMFYIRLLKRETGAIQPIADGIDTGSKKEAFTIKSSKHTFLNIQMDAVTWVKDAVEVRRNMRSTRRGRNTPCRQNKENRARGGIPPSTKARWDSKLRVCKWLQQLYPITEHVVEDVKAMTKGKRKWDRSFSPLEVGKQWFYGELAKLGKLTTRQGYETKALRDSLGLSKSKSKLAEIFSAHCVDSWVLANSIVGGHTKPDNERMLCITPLQFHRRQLHRLQPQKGGIRAAYGGTRSEGFRRGSLVKHTKHGLAYIGGTSKGLVSLHSVDTGKRLCQNAKVKDITLLTYNSWRTRLLKINKCKLVKLKERERNSSPE